MLSITKLAGRSMADLHNCVNYPDERGNEEQRGRDPFDEPRTALEAVDEYYDAGGVPSQWHGRAADELGLIGASMREQRRALMQGYAPSESRLAGEALVQNPGVARAYGWDLTFSPSKSVSVAWARADADTRAAIERAHDEAVAAALSEAERRLYARRGKDGAERDFTAGMAAATFRHASARPVKDEHDRTVVDPQLHTHAQVMNVSLSPDGHTGAAALNEVYRSKRELDGIYMASLAARLHDMGFAVERDTRNDSFRLADVPHELEKEFSHRRSEIERLMHEKGWEGARGAQYATLLTREGKEHLDPDAVIAEARVRARERGVDFSSEQVLRDKRQAHEIDLSALAQDLTRTRSVLRATEVRTTALLHAQWAGLSPAAADEAMAALTRQGELVTLYSPEATLYTTRAMVELERRMLASAEQLHSQVGHAIAPQALHVSVEQWQQQTGVTLNDGQRAALDYVAAGGDLRLLQGLPGTGKSTLLAAAFAAWVEAGYTVRGAAPTGKAAANLGESIPDSQTLARLRREWGEWSDDEGRLHSASRPLSEKDIVVIDEAGMMDSVTLERVLHQARACRAKVVLVGDERQLQPVTAGAPFKYLREHLGDGRLAEIVRQRDPSERERVAALHAGEVRAVFDALYAEGRV
ncbi:MAG TPA: MobF family relaxase, partial [Gammaproteobacteria bacterium]|nr:MobF family relaxase [Gammaproteobacteria bacterium]